jgi:phosphoenolpyruvate synthase/pyruvate phosphate dikinase
VPIRMRSSTNNEDLPGFSGAGLYDSFTHNPDEGHISKTVKQVFASLWNFRAFEAREFHRIDHLQAAMGVLVHPNYSNERANGVAVSDDIVYQTQGQRLGRTYYVNVQVGEDLVTNPDAESVPEEMLLNSITSSADRVVRMSSRAPGQSLLSPEHREEMRVYLNRIHNKFRELYKVQPGQPFAMDIEFKVTAEGRLEIKQARPWVY